MAQNMRNFSDYGGGASAASQPEPEVSRPQGSFLVATDNRTVGAVICGLLRGEGRSARWIARKDIQAEFTADIGVLEDIVLVEVDSAAAIAALLAVARDPQAGEGSKLVAITPEARPDLRAACESGGFEGCVSAPLEPAVLLDLVDAVLARSQGTSESLEAGAFGDQVEATIVDRRALDDLANLGGSSFVHEIVAQFVEDASSILKTLNEAVRSSDAAKFRDHVHALRSCAANVGANSVYGACLALREIQPMELAMQGAEHMVLLEHEFVRARDILYDYLKGT